jgi:hypothetical protein
MVTPIEAFVVTLREAGVTLILLWALTLSIVWGLLHHAGIPKSISARGVISIAAAFLVLLAAAASPAVAFLQNLIVATVLIGFGLIMAVLFLELTGVRVGGEATVFKAHPKFFASVILIIIVAVFVGAGGLNIIGLPAIEISTTILAFLLFIAVMVAAVYIMIHETSKEKEKK